MSLRICREASAKPACNVATMIIFFSLFMLDVCAQEQGKEFAHIIENVRQNESLFHDIDVEINEVYTLVREPEIFEDADQQEVISKALRVRHVAQDGMFRVQTFGSHTLADGTVVSLDRNRGFDGDQTLSFSQNTIGNVIKGRLDDPDLIGSHMLLLRSSSILVPLSTYLSGHDAVRSHPNGNLKPGLVLENSYRGVEEVDGLLCHEVWITTRNESRADWNDRWELLLCEEHNYLPMAIRGYLFRISETVPVLEGKVTEWKTLETGISFPARAFVNRFNDSGVKKRGVKQVDWTEEYVVAKTSLRPNMDIGFFRDISFPDGTSVYHIEDKKITKKYAVGAPTAPDVEAGDAFSGRWWLVWGNLAIVALVVLVIALRRR